MPLTLEGGDVVYLHGDSVLFRYSLSAIGVAATAHYSTIRGYGGLGVNSADRGPGYRRPLWFNYSVEGATVQDGINSLTSVSGNRPRATKLITNLGVNDMTPTPKATWLSRCMTYVADACTKFGIDESDILWVGILNRLGPVAAAEWNADNRAQLEAIGVNFVDVQAPYMARLGAGGSDPATDGIHPVDTIMGGTVEPTGISGKAVYASWAMAGVTFG